MRITKARAAPFGNGYTFFSLELPKPAAAYYHIIFEVEIPTGTLSAGFHVVSSRVGYAPRSAPYVTTADNFCALGKRKLSATSPYVDLSSTSGRDVMPAYTTAELLRNHTGDLT